jgi:hypothetical protein
MFFEKTDTPSRVAGGAVHRARLARSSHVSRRRVRLGVSSCPTRRQETASRTMQAHPQSKCRALLSLAVRWLLGSRSVDDGYWLQQSKTAVLYCITEWAQLGYCFIVLLLLYYCELICDGEERVENPREYSLDQSRLGVDTAVHLRAPIMLATTASFCAENRITSQFKMQFLKIGGAPNKIVLLCFVKISSPVF